MPTKYYTKALPLPNGKRKYIRGKTPEELAEKVAKAERELSLGIHIEDSTTVSQLAQLWFNTYKRGKVSKSTEQNILNRLNLHIVPVIGGMPVRDVKPLHVQQVINRMSAVSSCAEYQKQVLYTMGEIFRLAVDNDLIAKSPVTSHVEFCTGTKAPRIPLSEAEQARLLRASADLPAYYKTTYLLMLDAGLRRGEARGLLFSDIDLQTGYIHVRHQVITENGEDKLVNHTKTPAGQRTVPMTQRLWDNLKAVKARTSSVYVLTDENGAPLTHRSVTHTAEVASKLVGRHVHPHLLRHTFITNCVASGRFTPDEITYMAGHSNKAVTFNVYDHFIAEERIESTARKMRNAQ